MSSNFSLQSIPPKEKPVAVLANVCKCFFWGRHGGKFADYCKEGETKYFSKSIISYRLVLVAGISFLSSYKTIVSIDLNPRLISKNLYWRCFLTKSKEFSYKRTINNYKLLS